MAGQLTSLALNPDEVWLLYRLALGETSGGPCLVDQPHARHKTAAGTALAKLSDAVLALQETTTTKEQ